MAERQGFEPFSLHNLKQLHDAGGTDSQQLQPVAAVKCLLTDGATAEKRRLRVLNLQAPRVRFPVALPAISCYLLLFPCFAATATKTLKTRRNRWWGTKGIDRQECQA
jgi:hypothetical protein